MRVAVVGATGGTGLEILPYALEAGHEVVALARNPKAISRSHERLTVKSGNVYDSNSLTQAFEGCDAVISSLGRGGLLAARKPSNVLEEGTKNIIRVMASLDIERLVALSSVGVVEDPTESFIYRHFIKKLLRQLYEDMARMEALIRASDRAWTLVRPPYLTNGEAMGKYRLDRGGRVPYGYTLSRKDLARFSVEQLTATDFLRQTVGIANPSKRTPAP